MPGGITNPSGHTSNLAVFYKVPEVTARTPQPTTDASAPSTSSAATGQQQGNNRCLPTPSQSTVRYLNLGCHQNSKLLGNSMQRILQQ